MSKQALERSPLASWGKAHDSHYHKGAFHARSYCSCLNEQEGCADVQERTLHYWLYDTLTCHNGDADAIYSEAFLAWINEMGYAINANNIEESYPNKRLAPSVRKLMSERGCNISLTLIGDITRPYAVINEFFPQANNYKTTIYHLRKVGD